MESEFILSFTSESESIYPLGELVMSPIFKRSVFGFLLDLDTLGEVNSDLDWKIVLDLDLDLNLRGFAHHL